MQEDVPTVPARAKLDTALRSLMQKVGVTTPMPPGRDDDGPIGAPGCVGPRAVGQSTAMTPQSEPGPRASGARRFGTKTSWRFLSSGTRRGLFRRFCVFLVA
jgi:hypothetical protein